MAQLPFPYLDAAALRRAVRLIAAVDALEAMFATAELSQTPQRTHLPTESGDLLVMPATGSRASGVKIVGVAPGNPERHLPLIHGLYTLLDAETLVPVLVIDGAALTTLRTPAVSALATRHLARPDASRLVIFGAGVQGRAHLEAMRAVRPISWLRVVSRSPGPAETLVADAASSGLDAAVAEPGVVSEADIVCACTTSPEPVFDGALLTEGAHVNAVGAYTPETRELDDAAVSSADMIVVETYDAALAEAGDIVVPLASGKLDRAVLVELAEVVRGEQRRRSDRDITIFKSVGVAAEDLAVATAAWSGIEDSP